jgi:hypothetical protein
MIHLSKSMPTIHHSSSHPNKNDGSGDYTTTTLAILVALLAEEMKQRKQFQTKLNRLESVVTKCDVDHLVDSLLHDINDTNKQIYKTGVEFMKSTVSGILSSDK